jgi:hypothetical protein
MFCCWLLLLMLPLHSATHILCAYVLSISE